MSLWFHWHGVCTRCSNVHKEETADVLGRSPRVHTSSMPLGEKKLVLFTVHRLAASLLTLVQVKRNQFYNWRDAIWVENWLDSTGINVKITTLGPWRGSAWAQIIFMVTFSHHIQNRNGVSLCVQKQHIYSDIIWWQLPVLKLDFLKCLILPCISECICLFNNRTGHHSGRSHSWL